MRPELFTPAGGLEDVTLVHDVLFLAGADIPAGDIELWTLLERALACDWALRVHLRASDNPVAERPRPSFLRAREAVRS